MKLVFGISTHAPRTGSDANYLPNIERSFNFNPRSPHGERPIAGTDGVYDITISTHAPRTGSDYNNTVG